MCHQHFRLFCLCHGNVYMVYCDPKGRLRRRTALPVGQKNANLAAAVQPAAPKLQRDSVWIMLRNSLVATSFLEEYAAAFWSNTRLGGCSQREVFSSVQSFC